MMDKAGMVKSATKIQRDADLRVASRALVAKASVRAIHAGDELVRVDDFARRLNLRAKTVGNWLSAGRLTCVRLSAKSIRIPISELNRLLEEGTRLAKEKSA